MESPHESHAEPHSESHQPPSHKVRNTFLAGLLALMPIFITWQVLTVLFKVVDGVLGNSLNRLIQSFTGIEFHIPGLGILVTLLLVFAIGWLTRLLFFKRLLQQFESFIERIPLVASLYKASRQIVVPFTDHAASPFSKVALVEYPMVGRYTLGLVAKERVSDDPDDDRMVIFFPSNHLHLGYPVLLSSRDVTIIDMSVEDAIKFFVSCGVIGDQQLVTSGGKLVRPAPGHEVA